MWTTELPLTDPHETLVSKQKRRGLGTILTKCHVCGGCTRLWKTLTRIAIHHFLSEDQTAAQVCPASVLVNTFVNETHVPPEGSETELSDIDTDEK